MITRFGRGGGVAAASVSTVACVSDVLLGAARYCLFGSANAETCARTV